VRIAIAGAGNVGRSIAQELIGNGHEVMLIERHPRQLCPERVPEARWVLADACELSSLEEADLAGCDVVVAATGDDKANLVVSLLAKTEFAVPRVVARVNRAENEWLFTEQWGVDQAVSPPHLLTSLVEEAVTTGDLVRLLRLEGGKASIVEMKLDDSSPAAGKPVYELRLPTDTTIVAVLREGHVVIVQPETVLSAGDEVVALAAPDAEQTLREAVVGD
jgi:trk/ktr system potassium uptake protein